MSEVTKRTRRLVSKRHSIQEVKDAITKFNGNVSAAAKYLDLTRSAVQKRIIKEPELRQHLNDIRESYKDELEAAIMKKTIGDKPETIMQIFAAKCLLKDRGWIENADRQQMPDVKIAIVNYADGKPSEINATIKSVQDSGVEVIESEDKGNQSPV